MIVDRACYQDGVRLDPHTEPETTTHPGSSFVWLGMASPSSAELDAASAEFNLHPLAVEDAIKAHQRPKLEHYGDNWFLVIKTVRYVPERRDVVLGEILAFVADDFLVTVRHGDSEAVADVRRRVDGNDAAAASGPWAVVHLLADRVVDDYEGVLQHVEDLIADVQAQVFDRPHASHGAALFHLKHEILEFRQAVAPLAPPLEVLSDPLHSPAPAERQPYFRDVHDHVLRIMDRLRTIDDLLTSALGVNVAQVGMRQNEDMRKISAWVAIVAVPTMVAGIYGMNFEHMPELGWRYSYPVVLVVTVLTCYALYRNFKRRDWL